MGHKGLNGMLRTLLWSQNLNGPFCLCRTRRAACMLACCEGVLVCLPLRYAEQDLRCPLVLQIPGTSTAAARSIHSAESRRLKAGRGLPVSSGDSSGGIPRHQLQERASACAAALQHLARCWQKDEGLAASERLRQLSCRCACASACCRQPNQWSIPLGRLSPLFQHGLFSRVSG